MPKTKDAFALPIIQNREIKMPSKDEEVEDVHGFFLNMYIMGEEDVISRGEKIFKHIKKIERYRSELLDSLQDENAYIKAQNKLARAQFLLKEYRQALSTYTEELKMIRSLIKETEKNRRRDVLSKFSRRLKQARKKAGWTQTELARKVGTRLSNINAYEQARNEPGISFLKILSTVLDTPADWFLSDDQDDHN